MRAFDIFDPDSPKFRLVRALTGDIGASGDLAFGRGAEGWRSYLAAQQAADDPGDPPERFKFREREIRPTAPPEPDYGRGVRKPRLRLAGDCRIIDLEEGEADRLINGMLGHVKRLGSRYLRQALKGLRQRPPATPTEWGGFFVARKGGPVRALPAFEGTKCHATGCEISVADMVDNSLFAKRKGENVIGGWHTHPRCGPGWPPHHSDEDILGISSVRQHNKCYLGSFVVNSKGEISFHDVSGFRKAKGNQQFGRHRVHGWTQRDINEFCKLHAEWEKRKNWR